MAVFSVQTAELHILVAIDDDLHIPETGDGRPEGPGNDTQWRKVASVSKYCHQQHQDCCDNVGRSQQLGKKGHLLRPLLAQAL